MLLGVMSDTHDRLENVAIAIDIFKQKQVDMIIHCGDWVAPFTLKFFDQVSKKAGFQVPTKSVFGNNEGDIQHVLQVAARLTNPIEFPLSATLTLDIDQIKIAAYHGHDQALLESLILGQQFQIVLTGHTHQVRNEVINNVLVLNPGAVCLVQNARIAKTATIASLNTDDLSREVITLP